MSANKLSEIIRTEKDKFTTPNIYQYLGNGIVEVVSENFRNLKQDREFVLFFRYQDNYYFPVWFEFRSINNNLLFLFKEFHINSFSLLSEVLNSSLEKEEHYTAEIKALVYHTANPPPFSVLLPGFQIEKSQRVDVIESTENSFKK